MTAISKKELARAMETIRARLSVSYSLSLSEQQRGSCPDIGIIRQKNIWVSHAEFPPPPEDDVVRSLMRVVRKLGRGDGASDRLPTPSPASVFSEWVASREPEESETNESLSNEERYEKVVRATKRPITVFYIHGGAMHRNNRATVRNLISQLAASTGARFFSVDYRLCPQSPFPVPLLDLLILYLSLLYPPPGSSHKPVPSSSVIFCGESTGLNYCHALIQIILHLPRSSPSSPPRLRFHGRDVEVPAPAGCAGLSAASDLTMRTPSNAKYAHLDFAALDHETRNRYIQPSFPPCPLWPPPGRTWLNVYTPHDSLLYHPLVAPMMAADWTGAPPMWTCIGTERFGDSNLLTAKNAAACGVKVRVDVYDRMPHIFPMFLPAIRQTVQCMQDWADEIVEMAEGGPKETKGRMIDFEMNYREVDVQGMTELTVERARRIVEEYIRTERRWVDEHSKGSKL